MGVVMVTEQQVVDGVRKLIEELGGWCFKTWGGAQRAGLPDLIGCVRGRFVAIECKRPGYRHRGVSRLQQHVLDRIESAGGIAGVVDSVPQAWHLLEQVDG